ncbi:MAG: hypothetical protein ACRD59_03130 [Candidatus Acidiferrales bacterium]
MYQQPEYPTIVIAVVRRRATSKRFAPDCFAHRAASGREAALLSSIIGRPILDIDSTRLR